MLVGKPLRWYFEVQRVEDDVGWWSERAFGGSRSFPRLFASYRRELLINHVTSPRISPVAVILREINSWGRH